MSDCNILLPFLMEWHALAKISRMGSHIFDVVFIFSIEAVNKWCLYASAHEFKKDQNIHVFSKPPCSLNFTVKWIWK